MVVVVFRSRMKANPPADLGALAARLYELVSQMPGFVSYKDFSSEDGESVAIVEFESISAVDAWSQNSEHMIAKERGRTEVFSEYRIHVCDVIRTTKLEPSAS